MRPKVYLAGPITGYSYQQVVGWRRYAHLVMGNAIETISPMRGKEYLRGEEQVKDCYEGSILSSQKGITNRDRFDVQRCDVILMNLVGTTRVSIGSVIEMGWADIYRKPVILAMEDGNIHNHSMIREIATYYCPDLKSAIHATCKMFGLTPRTHLVNQ